MVESKNFILDNEGIAKITEEIDAWLAKQKVSKKNSIRASFLMESVLLDLEKNCKEPKEATLHFVKTFNRACLKLELKGPQFCPDDRKDRLDDYTKALAQNVGFEPNIIYKNGVNIITLDIPKNGVTDETFIIVAVILSVFLGLIKPYIPENIVRILSEYVFANFEMLFMNLLYVFAGILIFLSILSGVCGMGSVSDVNKKGRYLISKTMLIGILETGIFALVLLPFFKMTFGTSGGYGGLHDIAMLFISIIPSDPVTPFKDGNMLQIAFIALFVGSIVVMTGNKIQTVKDFICQGNVLFINIINFVCKFLPLYIVSALTLLFWENGFGGIANIWKPIVLCIIINFIYVLIKVLIVAIQYKASFSVIIKKILPSVAIGATTCSSMAAFGTVIDINKTKLGIAPEYSSFATPLKNVLHITCSASGFIATIYYFAEYSGTPVNVGWIVGVWLIVSLIQPAIPPVSGGMLIVLGLIMKQFGIPGENLGIAATMTLIMDFITTTARIAAIHMEVLGEAGHFKLLNKEILKRK